MGDRWHPTPWPDRFWAKVNKQGPNGCWIWTAYIGVGGYGQFSTQDPDYTTRYTHRLSWLLLRGPVPEGTELDHLCRVPACVNPDHLEPVSHLVNLLRGETEARRRKSKTHCIRGHELTPENTRVRPRGHGQRHCKTCDRESIRDWYARNRDRLNAERRANYDPEQRRARRLASKKDGSR